MRRYSMVNIGKKLGLGIKSQPEIQIWIRGYCSNMAPEDRRNPCRSWRRTLERVVVAAGARDGEVRPVEEGAGHGGACSRGAGARRRGPADTGRWPARSGTVGRWPPARMAAGPGEEGGGALEKGGGGHDGPRGPSLGLPGRRCGAADQWRRWRIQTRPTRPDVSGGGGDPIFRVSERGSTNLEEGSLYRGRGS